MFNEKEYNKQYYSKNRIKIKKYMKQYNKQYYLKNRDKIMEHVLQYQEDNKENRNKYMKKYRINNPDKKRIWDKKYREKNKDKIKIYNKKYNKENYKNIGLAISKSLKGNKAGRHWESLVGYKLIDLIKHLKKTIPSGYIWQDYINGKLHLDHILPIRFFQFKTAEDEEFKNCWCLYNLCLLSAKDNLSKHDSINNPILLGLLLKEMI